MRTIMRIGLAVCGMLALSACGAHYAQVPARLQLEPYGRVALVTFSSEQADKQWSTMATQRFAEALLASQSNIELVEVPVSDSTAKALAAADDPSALLATIGRDRHVPAVFLGHLTVSSVKPRGGLINAARGLKVSAEVSAQLSVRLLVDQHRRHHVALELDGQRHRRPGLHRQRDAGRLGAEPRRRLRPARGRADSQRDAGSSADVCEAVRAGGRAGGAGGPPRSPERREGSIARTLPIRPPACPPARLPARLPLALSFRLHGFQER